MAWHVSGVLRGVAGALRWLSPLDTGVGPAVGAAVRQVIVSGVSVTGPLVVTVLVVGVVVDFVGNLLAPFAQVLMLLGVTAGHSGVAARGLALAVLVGVVVVVGVLVESGPDTGVQRRFGATVEALPGVGSVYSSFDRMSEVMLESDTGSFQEVKLVEFPHADLYSLAFLTSEVATPPPGSEGDEEGMLVLFVPLAPNPVMGGFMVCVPRERVADVDMTVQEAFQAIVTSGVAMTDARPG